MKKPIFLQVTEHRIWESFSRHIYDFIGIWLMRFGRYFLGKSLTRCWICGRNPGMGLINGSGHWCQNCEDEWLKFHKPENGIVVDWRGLGRRTE
jgi:hypothetical protein